MEEEKSVGCPFELVENQALETARVLLLNLGARMLRGLKNQTTSDEHSSLLLCAEAITKEQTLRGSMDHHHTTKAVSVAQDGGR